MTQPVDGSERKKKIQKKRQRVWKIREKGCIRLKSHHIRKFKCRIDLENLDVKTNESVNEKEVRL